MENCSIFVVRFISFTSVFIIMTMGALHLIVEVPSVIEHEAFIAQLECLNLQVMDYKGNCILWSFMSWIMEIVSVPGYSESDGCCIK